MQRFEVNGAVRPIYGSLGVKRLRVEPYRGRNEWRFNSSGIWSRADW